MTLAALVATSMAMFSFNTNAQQSTGAQHSNKESNAQGNTVRGKVSSVDESAQTIVIRGKTFQVLPTTRITSNDQQANISDIKQGQQVTAQYKQSAENNLELVTVEVSPAAGGTSDDATSEAGASFSGKVSKVDPEAKTVVIDNKTYYVLPTTQITRNDSKANFTDIKTGSQLSGRYKQSAENKMEVLSLEIPQSVGGTGNDATSESGASFSGRVSRLTRRPRRWSSTTKPIMCCRLPRSCETIPKLTSTTSRPAHNSAVNTSSRPKIKWNCFPWRSLNLPAALAMMPPANPARALAEGFRESIRQRRLW